MNAKNKLEKLLKEKGRGSYTRLAEYLNVPRNYITRWAKDSNYGFPYDYTPKIAKFFNVPVEYFFEKEEENIPLTRYLPIIGEASCGVPTNHYYGENVEYYPVSNDLYSNERYLIKAVGDSMLPRIKDGDLVLCDASMIVENGDIVHYTLNGESGIKKLIKNENNAIMLMPLNTDYTPIAITQNDELKVAKCIKVIADL